MEHIIYVSSFSVLIILLSLNKFYFFFTYILFLIVNRFHSKRLRIIPLGCFIDDVSLEATLLHRDAPILTKAYYISEGDWYILLLLLYTQQH